MLSHDNLLFNSSSVFYESIGNLLEDKLPQAKDFKVLSYLPFSHIAGLAVDFIGSVTAGSQIYFARPDAF